MGGKYMPSNRRALRENFRQLLPIAGITTVVISTIVAAGLFFFFQGRHIAEEQLKDKLKSTAAAAAIQFDGDRITQIRNGDILQTSSLLREKVRKLLRTKHEVTNIRFAYIMRKTRDPMVLEFVADADLGLTKEQLDVNRNDVVDSEEEPSPPGTLYSVHDITALQKEAFLHPTTDDRIIKDQWGLTISGYAPIHNAKGQAVAVLGLDMDATDFTRLSQGAFSPAVLLLIVLAALSIGGGTLLYLWKRRLETMERLEIERSGLLRLAFHQLGGPLTIINWSIEELTDEGPRSLQRTIANIQEGVRRLTKILKTLKEADLVHSGHIEYRPELVSLSTILEKVVHGSGEQLAVRKQRITLALAENITMRLDPTLIAGVAQELLTNAIDFSPDGAAITVRSRRRGNFAEFEVEDHGCGIPRRDLRRIFSEFTRGSNATRYKADGNGLGLYIVRGIIEHAGGRVSAKSEEGQGTIITVRLPIA